MFKKLFFGGLALLLALGLALQAGPALAMGNAGGLVVGPPAPALAQIKSVVLLETYPYQLKITGTLPSSCYQLRVSIPRLGDDPKNGGASPLPIWVRGVFLRGSICTQALKPFSTTLTLDPAKLNLAPGKYVALVNPVNGQSRFKVEFSVRPPYVDIVPAIIKQLVVMESYPPQFSLTGTLPAACYQPQISAPKVSGTVISIFVRGVAPKGMPCGEALRFFLKTVTIDPVKLKLAPGTYTVLFNPVNGASRFKATMTVR